MMESKSRKNDSSGSGFHDNDTGIFIEFLGFPIETRYSSNIFCRTIFCSNKRN